VIGNSCIYFCKLAERPFDNVLVDGKQVGVISYIVASRKRLNTLFIEEAELKG